ncbi:hypothetical protein ACT17_32650 [Mycolicibacterium conceptionense]|uniref:Uncharacterized protein n=1 Tax=Mycolicibacterium conceptionense TaxID=451644 RepID=A0A0J8TX08_9MYCO|nr:hypothetical protein [Mycolicibacterium conceptionense]KMV13933.1 hypothetical protein ACT17_32650 [Mycolicibacterium conceptionense]
MTSEGFWYRVHPAGVGRDQAPWQWEVLSRDSGIEVASGLADSQLEAIEQAQAEVASRADGEIEAAARAVGPGAAIAAARAGTALIVPDFKGGTVRTFDVQSAATQERRP